MFHNGDFSGSVELNISRNTFTSEEYGFYSDAELGNYSIMLPFDILRKLVLEHLRRKQIEHLEYMDIDEYQEYLTNGKADS